MSGDHKHLGELKIPIQWVGLEALLAEFDRDIYAWRQANENPEN